MSNGTPKGGNATSRPALTPPLKWHIDGGKHYLAKRIVELMPPHLHYVEPYFGGGSVLLEKEPEGVSEVVNDLNDMLTIFWKVLQNSECFFSFQRIMETTPFSETEWKAADLDSDQCPSRVEMACAFFVRCRQSLAGRMKGFAPLSKTRVRRGMNEQASAWIAAVDGLPAVHARLRRVVILCRDALDVIEGQDGKDSLFYCDPPYLHQTRATTKDYQHELSFDEHVKLLDVLSHIKGKFLLSGYRSELYDREAERCKWRRVDFELPNNASGGDEKRRMTECVWMNY